MITERRFGHGSGGRFAVTAEGHAFPRKRATGRPPPSRGASSQSRVRTAGGPADVYRNRWAACRSVTSGIPLAARIIRRRSAWRPRISAAVNDDTGQDTTASAGRTRPICSGVRYNASPNHFRPSRTSLVGTTSTMSFSLSPRRRTRSGICMVCRGVMVAAPQSTQTENDETLESLVLKPPTTGCPKAMFRD
jgi:hypothetical protein